jgi:hypothetical protein
MESFYISLPSNVTSFANNTMTDFKTRLFKTITLPTDYEIGLAEISFPGVIDNDPDFVVGIMRVNRFGGKSFAVNITNKEFVIQRKHMKNTVDFLSYVNSNLKAIGKELGITLIELNLFYELGQEAQFQFSKFEMDDGIAFVTIYGDLLAEAIGYSSSTSQQDLNISGQTIGGRVELMSAPVTSNMFIYCNIINHQYVGDAYVQLLRCVPINETTHLQTIYYSSPHYVPLITNVIDVIEISIKDDGNTPIRFISGTNKVILKLHFRPKQYGFQ